MWLLQNLQNKKLRNTARISGSDFWAHFLAVKKRNIQVILCSDIVVLCSNMWYFEELHGAGAGALNRCQICSNHQRAYTNLYSSQTTLGIHVAATEPPQNKKLRNTTSVSEGEFWVNFSLSK